MTLITRTTEVALRDLARSVEVRCAATGEDVVDVCRKEVPTAFWPAVLAGARYGHTSLYMDEWVDLLSDEGVLIKKETENVVA